MQNNDTQKCYVERFLTIVVCKMRSFPKLCYGLTVHLETLKPKSLKIPYSGQIRGSVMFPAAAKGFLIVLCWKSFDYFVSRMTAIVFNP